MPHFNFKNIKIEDVKKLSIEKTQEIADAFNCPIIDITYDVMEATSIINGEVIDGDNTIIVQMFERDQETKDKIASIMEEYFKNTTVIFQIIELGNYYENGKNFL